MKTKKLEAKLIDIGVVEETDTVVINNCEDSVYITVVSGLNNVSSYIFQNNKLVMFEGTNMHLSDILRLKDLDLEEFE